MDLTGKTMRLTGRAVLACHAFGLQVIPNFRWNIMKKADFVILCLKLLGIYFFVLGLSSLSSVLSVILQSTDSKPYISISPFMYIVAGSILFASAKRISTYILEFSETDDDITQIVATK
jgi:hypothetical protein